MIEMIYTWSVAVSSKAEEVLLGVSKRSTECRGFEMGVAVVEV